MFGIKKEILDAEEGPDWIKELNKLVSNPEEDPSVLPTVDSLKQDQAETASLGKRAGSMSVSNSDQSIKTIDSSQLPDSARPSSKMQQPLTLPISNSLDKISKEKAPQVEDESIPAIKSRFIQDSNWLDPKLMGYFFFPSRYQGQLYRRGASACQPEYYIERQHAYSAIGFIFRSYRGRSWSSSQDAELGQRQLAANTQTIPN